MKLCTVIMGFTIHKKKTPVPPNAGNEIQSCVGMLNFTIWGIRFIKEYPQKHRIFLIQGNEFPNIFKTKRGN